MDSTDTCEQARVDARSCQPGAASQEQPARVWTLQTLVNMVVYSLWNIGWSVALLLTATTIMWLNLLMQK